MKSYIKGLLGADIPEVDLNALKTKTLCAIKEYEERRERQSLYFMPVLGFNLLVILFALNFYSFAQELAYLYPLIVRDGGGYSARTFIRMFLAVVDNGLVIALNLGLIMILNRRFLGIRRAYRFVSGRIAGIFRFLVRAPGFARNMLKRS